MKKIDPPYQNLADARLKVEPSNLVKRIAEAAATAMGKDMKLWPWNAQKKFITATSTSGLAELEEENRKLKIALEETHGEACTYEDRCDELEAKLAAAKAQAYDRQQQVQFERGLRQKSEGELGEARGRLSSIRAITILPCSAKEIETAFYEVRRLATKEGE